MRVNVAESVAFSRNKEIHGERDFVYTFFNNLFNGKMLFNHQEDENSYENVVDLTSTVAVRTYFPETWLWDLVNLE